MRMGRAVHTNVPEQGGVPAAPRPHWVAFALICVAYLVSTTGEQLLWAQGE